MENAPKSARAQLADLAAGQYGMFTSKQALDAGLSRRQLHVMKQREEINAVELNEQVLPGVHRVSGSPAQWPADVMAACLGVGGGAVACLETALQLHGLRPPDPEQIHVCRAARWQPVVRGITVHTTRDLIDGDWVTVGAVPTTSGARTVIDMARLLNQTDRLELVDEIVFGGLAARQWLYRRAVALQNGRTGVMEIIRVTSPGAEPTFRSWLERKTNVAFNYYGVPEPAWNVPVDDDKGRIGIVDCLWQGGLIVEIEGLRFHTSPEQRRRDAPRFNRLVRRGPVLRYTWHDVMERPAAMCAEILDVLGAVDPEPNR